MSLILIAIQSTLLIASLIRFRNYPASSITVIFMLSIGATSITYPLASSFFSIITWRNIDHLNDSLIIEIQFLYLIFSISFMVIHSLLTKFSRAYPQFVSKSPNLSLSTASPKHYTAVLMLILGFAIYFPYITAAAGSLFSSNLAEKYSATVGLGFFSFGFEILVGAVIFLMLSTKSKIFRYIRYAVWCFLAIFALSVLKARYEFIMLVGGLWLIYCHKNDIRVRNVNILYLLPGVILLFLLEFFTIMRNFDELNFEYFKNVLFNSAVWGGLIGGSEFIHPFITASEILSSQKSLITHEYSRLGLVTNLFPSFLQPQDGFLNEAQIFCRDNYPDLYLRGGGTGFSLIASGYIYFGGLVGVAFLASFLAVIMFIIDSVVARRHFLTMIFWPPIFPLVLIADRFGLAGFLKKLFLIGIFIFVGICAQMLVQSLPKKEKLI